MKNKRNSGEVVVEASIIVSIVVILISIMLFIGMVLYQQTLIAVMANQTASSISKVYSNHLKDPFTGYVDPDRVYQPITYSNMKTDAYMDVVKQKANIYAQYRMRSSAILASENMSVDIDVVKKPNELLKSQLVVTIHGQYDIPLVGIFGINGLVDFDSTGRADCVDILEYVNGVDAIGDPDGSNITSIPDMKTCTITFIPRRDNPADAVTVKVMKGKSILSSNNYTHSTMPADPVQSGSFFDGWVDEHNNPFTATTTVNNDILIYGAWKCNVTLHGEGGTVHSQDSYMLSVSKGARTVFPDAQRSGYHFRGWFTRKNGAGDPYLSNDTYVMNDIDLYAHWECAHPSRYEERSGVACTGGTIVYKCTQCHIELGRTTFSGAHNFSGRCNVRHKLREYFDGCVDGGCWGYHVVDQWCSTCGVTHNSSNPVAAYCFTCIYCHQTDGRLWCASRHRYGSASGKPAFEPSNGHAYG